MKKIIVLILILCLQGCNISSNQFYVENGIYLVLDEVLKYDDKEKLYTATAQLKNETDDKKTVDLSKILITDDGVDIEDAYISFYSNDGLISTVDVYPDNDITLGIIINSQCKKPTLKVGDERLVLSNMKNEDSNHIVQLNSNDILEGIDINLNPIKYKTYSNEKEQTVVLGYTEDSIALPMYSDKTTIEKERETQKYLSETNPEKLLQEAPSKLHASIESIFLHTKSMHQDIILSNNSKLASRI